MATSAKKAKSPGTGTIILLFLLLGVLVYLTPCPSETQFIYFKVALALVAGLFGWLIPGFIRFNATWASVTVKATAGMGLFMIVLIYAPQLSTATGKCANTQYTIILRDSTSRTIPDLSGSLSILIKNNVQKAQIQSDGSVEVKGITVDMENYLFNVELHADNWVFAATRSKTIDTAFRNDRLVLRLVQDDAFCCISGVILDKDARKLPDVAMYHNGNRTNVDSGEFRIIIPPAARKETHTIRFEKEGYQPVEKTISIITGVGQQIYMHKK
jgi:hypothetical protein